MRDFLMGILELSVGMSFLTVLLFLVLKLFGGRLTAKCRYILWTLVLLRLAVPFGGLLPSVVELSLPAAVTEVGEAAPSPSPASPSQTEIPTASPQPSGNGDDSPTAVLPEAPIDDSPAKIDIVAALAVVYCGGAAVFFLWHSASYLIFTGGLRKHAREADETARGLLNTLCRKKKLRHVPLLLVSRDIQSPAAFGFFRRRIVLPEMELSENGLVGTLAHEVTHCKRGDLQVKLIALAARSFHWFNPLVHMAAFRCEMEMELSCDEAVLCGCSDEGRVAYGEVMLDIVRRCRRSRGVLTTHFSPKKRAVAARFKNILYGSGKGRGYVLIGLCLVLCLLAGAFVACKTEPPAETDGPAAEQPSEETADQPPEEESGSDVLAVADIQTEEHVSISDVTRGPGIQGFLTVSYDKDAAVNYFFTAGLTYYSTPLRVSDYCKYTLSLPEGYADGEILCGIANYGTGELNLIVRTDKGHLSYLVDTAENNAVLVRRPGEAEMQAFATQWSSHTVDIYRCWDVSLGENAETHGTATVWTSALLTDYTVSEVQVRLCEDGCDPAALAYRGYWGNAEGWQFEVSSAHTTAEGWNYNTWVFPNVIPKEIQADRKAHGAPESVYAPREYIYLMAVDDVHYVYVVLRPRFYGGEVPADEAAYLNSIMKEARVVLNLNDAQ